MFISFSDNYGQAVNNRVQMQPQNHRSGRRAARRERMDEMRAIRAEQEARMQRTENARIEGIARRIEAAGSHIRTVRDQIDAVHNTHGEELEALIREIFNGRNFTREEALTRLGQQIAGQHILIDSHASSIGRIHENRADRTETALEMEVGYAKTELKLRMREREEQAEEAAENQGRVRDEEEIRDANERDMLSNMARHDTNQKVINELTHVRELRYQEAARLNRAISSPNSSSIRIIDIEPGLTVEARIPNGRANPDDFRNSHLRKVNEGIKRIDVSIVAHLADMYRTSMEQGEEVRSESRQRDEEYQEALQREVQEADEA